MLRVSASLWVMPAWQPLRYVAFADAATLVRARAARSEMELEQIWADPAVAMLIDGASHIDIARTRHLYDDHALVKCSDLDAGRPRCSCDVFPGESLCAHALGLLAKERPGRCPWLHPQLPLGTGGRAGAARTGRGRGGAFNTQEEANALMDREAAAPRPTRKRVRDENEADAVTSESARGSAAPAQPPNGAEALVLPCSFQTSLANLFAPSDIARVEGMCWMLAERMNLRRVVQLVMADHEATSDTCSSMGSGDAALVNFLSVHPRLVVVGWAHSHHSRHLSTPSAADVLQQWRLHVSMSPTFVMAIGWQRGLQPVAGHVCWQMAPSRVAELTATQGAVQDRDFTPVSYLARVPLRYEEYVMEIARLGRHHVAGAPIPVSAGSPSRVRVASAHSARSSLDGARATALLLFLRGEGPGMLRVAVWLPRFPLPPPRFSTVQQQQGAVIAALLELERARNIFILKHTQNQPLTWAVRVEP